MNLKLMLDETVNRYATKTAMVLDERRVSYAEVDEASNKVANALIKVGLRKGERVVTLLSNSLEFVVAYFGVIKAGGIAVPLDIRYKVEELASLFTSCQPKVLIAESAFLEPLVPVLSRFESVEHVIDIGGRYEGRFLSYREIMATSSAQRVEVALEPDDIATVSYTGGPSNHPRGAAFSHRSLVAEANISGDGFQQTDKDLVMLFALPMYHMFSLASVLLTSISRGSTVVVVPGTGVSISSLMEAIEKERGTILMGVPYIYALAVNVAEREGIKNNLSSLRLCVSGGASLSIEVIRQFKRYYGYTITDIWGLTEAVSQVTCPPMDGTGKLGSVGKALPGWEIKAVDDNGDELSQNQPGEVIVKGPIMKGYYNNPQATAEIIKDGWLYTGDMGRVDEDGYLFLTGMKKDIIILKGQNVYPSDIEEVLSTHPKVDKAIVIGIPDKVRGEIVGAAISLKEGEVTTEQEIRQFCQERMADYKLPRQIIFTNSLPTTIATKISRENLRDYLSTLSSLPSSTSQKKAEL